MNIPNKLLLACFCILLITGCSKKIEPKDLTYISKDLHLDFSKNFTIVSYNEDLLGFDLTIETTLKFADEDAKSILSQIKAASNYQGEFTKDPNLLGMDTRAWFKKVNMYYYSECSYADNSSTFSACWTGVFDPEAKQLNYKYWDF